MTTVNIYDEGAGHHNVGICMVMEVDKEKYKEELRNTEGDRRTEWQWKSWDELMKDKDKLFKVFEVLRDQDYGNLETIRMAVGY